MLLPVRPISIQSNSSSISHARQSKNFQDGFQATHVFATLSNQSACWRVLPNGMPTGLGMAAAERSRSGQVFKIKLKCAKASDSMRPTFARQYHRAQEAGLTHVR